MYIIDWYLILVGLVGGIILVVDGLDGYDVWLVISEGWVLLCMEILYNIDLFYNYVQYGFLEGGFGIWNIVVQVVICVGEWKLLIGDFGYGDWILLQILVIFLGSWWNLE